MLAVLDKPLIYVFVSLIEFLIRLILVRIRPVDYFSIKISKWRKKMRGVPFIIVRQFSDKDKMLQYFTRLIVSRRILLSGSDYEFTRVYPSETSSIFENRSLKSFTQFITPLVVLENLKKRKKSYVIVT